MEGGTCFAAILLLAFTSSCTARDSATNVGTSVIPMKQLYFFSSLPQMVATSDLVITGTVRKTEPGRVMGEGDGAMQFGQVTLSVDRLLFGEIETSTVVIEESGLEHGHPSQVGDHGLYFLHQKADAPQFFRLVNSQGRFLDDRNGRLVALDDEAAWAKAMELLSVADLETVIEAAARDVAGGKVPPAKPNLP